MELISKLQKKLRSCQQEEAAIQQEMKSGASTIKILDERNTALLLQVKQRFTRQLNHYKDQQQRTSHRIKNTYESNLESQQWYELQKKILTEDRNANEELKKYQHVIDNNQAYSDQCRKEIQKEQIARKANNESQFQSNFDKPVRKIQQIQNRLLKGKGVQMDEKQDKIKIRIRRNNSYQIYGHNQLLEYQLFFSKKDGKYLPGGNYSKDVNKLICYFDFHRDLGKLEQELEELNSQDNYA